MKPKNFLRSVFQSLKLRRSKIQELTIQNKKTLPVIVTLTTIPSRINKVDITIRSILCQEHRPEKVILWLNHELKGKLPRHLTELESEIFEINFRGLTSSHRKLIFALQEYPENCLITCDDDLIYHPHWLKKLYTAHLENPEDIIANSCRMITYKDGQLMPYKAWEVVKNKNFTNPKLVPIGFAGVLYPSGSLYHEVTNSELFMKLAPKADDLWFKAMATLQGTSIRKPESQAPRPLHVIGSQGASLSRVNVDQDMNRKQWQALTVYYQLNL
jgi:hypothetical protein